MSEALERKEYFSSYADIEVHKLMLQDGPRTDAYRDMIMKNKDFFKDKVVMDVGAGSGILSLLCFRAGAKKVYAVEASPMSKMLEDIVKINKADGVIKVLPQRVEEVELDEQVDIIVSEWMGFYLLHESMLNSVVVARDKHLKDDGVMLPSHAKVYAALSKHEDSYWNDVYGFDMTPIKDCVTKNSGKPAVDVVPKEALLSDPQLLTTLDLRWVTEEELKEVSARCFTSVTQTGMLRGLLIWFDCDFEPWTEDSSWQVPVTLSTAPHAAPTHWKQTLVNLPEAFEVEVDEVIGWEIGMRQDDEKPRFYNLTLGMLDPSTEEHPVPCGCQMAKCALIQALLQKEEDAAVAAGMELEQALNT